MRKSITPSTQLLPCLVEKFDNTFFFLSSLSWRPKLGSRGFSPCCFAAGMPGVHKPHGDRDIVRCLGVGWEVTDHLQQGKFKHVPPMGGPKSVWSLQVVITRQCSQGWNSAPPQPASQPYDMQWFVENGLTYTVVPAKGPKDLGHQGKNITGWPPFGSILKWENARACSAMTQRTKNVPSGRGAVQ